VAPALRHPAGNGWFRRTAAGHVIRCCFTGRYRENLLEQATYSGIWL